MRKVRKLIQRIRSAIYHYRIRLYLYDNEKIRGIVMITISTVIACLYVWSVGQASLEEIRYTSGVPVVGF